jgi:hypothetical protein
MLFSARRASALSLPDGTSFQMRINAFRIDSVPRDSEVFGRLDVCPHSDPFDHVIQQLLFIQRRRMFLQCLAKCRAPQRKWRRRMTRNAKSAVIASGFWPVHPPSGAAVKIGGGCLRAPVRGSLNLRERIPTQGQHTCQARSVQEISHDSPDHTRKRCRIRIDISSCYLLLAGAFG